MNNYRKAFLAAFAINILLAAGLGWLWWHGRFGPPSAAIKAAGQAETGTPLGGQASPPSAAAETPLIPVQLTAERRQSIGVKTGAVEYENVFNEIRTVGNVAADERRLAYVQLRFAGWIRKVFVDATYDYVRKGQPLFTVYSPDLVTTEQEYLLAKKNGNLLAQSTVPGVAAGATSLVDAASERLKQWEIPEREISRLESSGKAQDYMEIDSPVSGYVTERNALPSLYAQPETRLYTIADLSTIWVYAEVFQNEVGQIKVGDPAAVTADAYPGRTFAGRVDSIYPEVDMATRTVKVRFVMPNPGLKLTPGMFVNVDLRVPLGRQLTIPASAVLHSGTRTLAFVDRGDGTLEPRDLELGPQAGDEFIVLKGVKAGEQVVTSANFLIDSESQLQAAMGSFAPPPPGAGAAAAMNAPASAAKIEFTSDPSPPHKGSNTFRVKLTASDGALVTGAQVTVTFFKPGMPAMGMAAMRAATTLGDKGGGLYEGPLNLEGGGTWQVTVVAQKNGQTLATKQLSVNVEGGA
jgi:membrane fusion protein, copper/silver efflux system